MADVDILGRLERRRIWGAQEKVALLAEVDAEGGKVRLVARRHGGTGYRRACSTIGARRAKRAAVAAGAADDVKFVPVGVVGGKALYRQALLARPEPTPAPEPRQRNSKAGRLRSLPNGSRVSVDAFVNEKALSRVLRAMKGLA